MAIERQKVEITRQSAGIKRQSVKIDRTAPDFESMFDDGDESMLAGVEQTGDFQVDADENMSAALREIIERKKATQERFRISTDPEFFFCVVFQSREQKEQFLEGIGWMELGDKYINGLEVARRLGIPVDIVSIEPLPLRGKPNRFRKGEVLGD